MGRFKICAMMGVCALGAVSSGCGTIVHGGTETVNISSVPSGATAEIPGYGDVRTPATVELDRSNDYAVTFTLDGYETRTATVKSGLSPWVFGNIIFGGLIGIVIDAATGSTGNLTPDSLVVDMRSGEVGNEPPEQDDSAPVD